MSTTLAGVQKKAIYTGHRDCIYTLEKYADNQHFLSASGDGMVASWKVNDPEQGELVAKVPNSVYAIRFLAETNQLLVGQNFEGIHLIDLNVKQEIRSLKLTDTYIFDFQLFNNQLFIAFGDGDICKIDLATFMLIKSLKPSNKSARTMAINPILNEIAVGFSDFMIRIYDVNTFKLKYEWTAHSNSVFSLSFSPDFKNLVSAGRDATIKIWNTWNNYELQESIIAHMYAINSVAFSPDGALLATGSMDKTVKIWDTEKWKLLKVLDKSRHAGHATSVNKVLWLDDENLVSASDDKTISLWEISH